MCMIVLIVGLTMTQLLSMWQCVSLMCCVSLILMCCFMCDKESCATCTFELHAPSATPPSPFNHELEFNVQESLKRILTQPSWSSSSFTPFAYSNQTMRSSFKRSHKLKIKSRESIRISTLQHQPWAHTQTSQRPCRSPFDQSRGIWLLNPTAQHKTDTHTHRETKWVKSNTAQIKNACVLCSISV